MTLEALMYTEAQWNPSLRCAPLCGGSRQRALKHLKHSEALQTSAQDAAVLVWC